MTFVDAAMTAARAVYNQTQKTRREAGIVIYNGGHGENDYHIDPADLFNGRPPNEKEKALGIGGVTDFEDCPRIKRHGDYVATVHSHNVPGAAPNEANSLVKGADLADADLRRKPSIVVGPNGDVNMYNPRNPMAGNTLLGNILEKK